MTSPKQIGGGFEYRVLAYIDKNGFTGTKRQALSGACRYQEDKGDLTGTYPGKNMSVDFLFECKKTTKGNFGFCISWMEETRLKAEKMIPNRVPIIVFSGQRIPIYCALEKKFVYQIFGNHDMIIRKYEARGEKTITLNWNKLNPLLYGHEHEKSKFLHSSPLLTGVELPKDIYLFFMDDFVKHLNFVLNVSTNTI